MSNSFGDTNSPCRGIQQKRPTFHKTYMRNKLTYMNKIKCAPIFMNKGLYTWSDLHTYANFAYMHIYMCTHLLTYATFARMQKLENLHLPQTKCKSHFAYMQILHICKSVHVNAKQNLHT